MQRFQNKAKYFFLYVHKKLLIEKNINLIGKGKAFYKNFSSIMI